MRPLVSLAILVFVVLVCAVPITPSAPELQRRAEQFRLEGLKENEISAKLALQINDIYADARPALSPVSSKWYSVLRHCPDEEEERDISGDIAPGSLDTPDMLPRSSVLEESFLARIVALLQRHDADAYEGKELELRRPTGMRHWGAQDKWRLF